MTWEVYAYVHRRTGTYDGRGSSASTFRRRFDDKPSALRFAQAIVEAGPAHIATVTFDPGAGVRALRAGAERDGPEA